MVVVGLTVVVPLPAVVVPGAEGVPVVEVPPGVDDVDELDATVEVLPDASVGLLGFALIVVDVVPLGCELLDVFAAVSPDADAPPPPQAVSVALAKSTQASAAQRVRVARANSVVRKGDKNMFW